MIAMAEHTTDRVDYDGRASEYARHRTIHPEVLRELVTSGIIGPETRVLDVGCGTGNYAAALTAATNCRVSGVDPSPRMLDLARDAAPWESLERSSAENLPFSEGSFDVVMSTDVIHHIRDRAAYFQEAARVLRPGGQLITVTDSHDAIRRRRPLSSHFPETVSVELQRYPPVPTLLAEIARAGFVEPRLVEVSRDHDLDDIQAYRERAFSSLHLIEEDAFRRGISRLEGDLARGPIPCVSLYTMIWGQFPSVYRGDERVTVDADQIACHSDELAGGTSSFHADPRLSDEALRSSG
jgi:ubiquinone/menaquinone biosynthesis C-methylase UbiE